MSEIRDRMTDKDNCLEFVFLDLARSFSGQMIVKNQVVLILRSCYSNTVTNWTTYATNLQPIRLYLVTHYAALCIIEEWDDIINKYYTISYIYPCI